MPRVPSLAALVATFPHSDTAALAAWRDTAKRKHWQVALHAADIAIEGYGGEAIRCPSRGLLAVYVNTGDTYSPTLLCNIATGAWRITTWGDYVEVFERRNGRNASGRLMASHA